MPLRDLAPLLPALLVPALSVGCGEAGACDADALRARLARASSGETVRVGACTLQGPFEVPPGVTLEGTGTSLIVAPADGQALTLAPSPSEATPTRVAALSVRSTEGCAGVVAVGAGAIALSDLTVNAETGVAVAVEGVGSVAIDDTQARGPVTVDGADTTMPPLPPFECGRDTVATHGIVLVDVASATIVDSATVGFGRFGLLGIRSASDLRRFEARDNLGAGIEVWGGSAQLSSVTVERTGDGAGAIEAYGVVLGGGATAESTDLSVTGGDGYGVFADGAVASHDSLVAIDNGFAGAWAQNTTGFSLTGDATEIARNTFAGVAVFESTGVSLEDATIRETASGVAVTGVSTVTGADGVHVSASEVALSDVVLRENPRVGVVLDLDGASTSSRVSLANVTVEGSGSALGAIAQNGAVEAGWDDDVRRLGEVADNDMAFDGTLEIAEGVGPPCLPPLGGIETDGIAELVGP